jgi:hypothetical protein
VNRHRWCWWRGCCLSRQLLASSGRGVLRSDVLRTVVVRRIVIIQSFKLQLQLSFTLTSGFNLGALSRKSAFLFLLFLLSSYPALLLLCLLQFALLHLFLECTKSGLCSLTLLGQVVFLSTFFLPSMIVSDSSILMSSSYVHHAVCLGFLCFLLVSQCLLSDVILRSH